MTTEQLKTPVAPRSWDSRDRIAAVGEVDAAVPGRLDRLLPIAERGLRAGHLPEHNEFAQTVRGVTGGTGVHVVKQGRNLRYAAMAALGLSCLPETSQRAVLREGTAVEVVEAAVRRAERSDDPGAVAITAWAAAEVTGTCASPLFERWERWFASDRPLPTVDVAWLLTAAVAASPFGDTDRFIPTAAGLLRRHHGEHGIYPHVLPPRSQPRWRAHVGSFADQVYPLQALSRASVLTGEADLLHAANQTARRLADLQGHEGQWWWHYDIRDGSVVEAFPVYSVHQHAMAPMVLLDLLAAGGEDHRREVALGLSWLDQHPEVVEELISDRFGLIWRKVGRRENHKLARGMAALTTSVRPGLHPPGVDRWLPPGVVDHECRPYELGWLLYAWLSTGGGRR